MLGVEFSTAIPQLLVLGASLGTVFLYRFEPPVTVEIVDGDFSTLDDALEKAIPKELGPGVHDVSFGGSTVTTSVTVYDDSQGDTYGVLAITRDGKRITRNLPNTGNGHMHINFEPIPKDPHHVLLHSLIKSQPKQT